MTNLHLGTLPKQKLGTEVGSQFPMQIGPFIYSGVSDVQRNLRHSMSLYKRLMAACSHAQYP